MSTAISPSWPCGVSCLPTVGSPTLPVPRNDTKPAWISWKSLLILILTPLSSLSARLLPPPAVLTAIATATMDIDPKYDHYDFPTECVEPLNGHAGHLTEEQIAQVHQLRMMLEAEGYKDRLDTLTLVCSPEVTASTAEGGWALVCGT